MPKRNQDTRPVCPISLEPFTDPVVASDGWTYERFAIEQWMITSSTSPCVSGHTLSPVLYPNHALKPFLPKSVANEVIVIDD